MKKNILIIGSGSYIIDDNYGNGVVLRSLLQLNKIRFDNFFKIIMFYRSEEKKIKLMKKLNDIKLSEQVIIKDLNELDELIEDNDIFASFIGVPDVSHSYYINKFINKKIPTWIVKPVTDNLEEALQIKSESNSKLLWIDYHKRFDQSNMLIKKYIKDNVYGKLLNYSVQYSQPYDLPIGTFEWAKDTNVFSYIGCHYVDQLEFLFGKSIKNFSITSNGTKGKVHKLYGKDCYDSIISIIKLNLEDSQEIICNFQIGWSDPKGTPSKSHQRVELTFENGRIIMDQKERGVEVWDENKLHQLNPYFFTEYFDSYYNDYFYSGYGYESIKYFLEFAENRYFENNDSLPILDNVLFSEYVLDASRKSLRKNGQWIKMEMIHE